ncbi:MAG: hypothetical protein IJ001_01390 [Oscillospiraceae bacterium]|nr:hypothetical protein [Oscillospiraceae bacterium]
MRRKSRLCLVLSWIFLLSVLAPILPGNASAQEERGLFFGRLYALSSLTSGSRTAGELYADAKEAGLDFLAVTDQSSAFDNWELAAIGADASFSAAWAAGKAASEAASDETFAAIYGYEMNFHGDKLLGHIATFNTPGFVTRDQEPYKGQNALENYYDALSTVPGAIGMLCHLGSLYGDFQNLAHYSQHRDAAVSLLEVGSGSDAFVYYDLALDKGWHVAPANNSETGRTAVLAESLTEEGIYEALSSRRAYATEDADLEISYTLNGCVMGSRLEKRETGERAEIAVEFYDPTDTGEAAVEVITDGGVVSAGCTLEGGSVRFTLPADRSWYYIRVTQADGDRAVTAPVWIDQTEDAGIRSFTASLSLPLQNQKTELTLELYNEESETLTVQDITVTLDGEIIHRSQTPLRIGNGETIPYSFAYVHPGLGRAELTATVTASLGDRERVYTETLTLIFRAAELVSGVLADGSHGNAGLDTLSEFSALAAEQGQELTVVKSWSENVLTRADLLVVTAPSVPFSEEFLHLAAEFVGWGGSLVVCGQSDALDGAVHTSFELNRLLSAVGSQLRLEDNEVRDPRENLGLETNLTLGTFNKSSHLYLPELENRIFRQSLGCSVTGGTWLVKGYSGTYVRDADGDGGGSGGTTVLAWEKGSGGGDILAAGGLFLTDDFLRLPTSLWKEPYANRAFAAQLLGIRQEQLTLTKLSEIRSGTEGKAYRLRGWVTAGAEEGFDAVYVQDDTGGIALLDYEGVTLPLGTALEVTGVLSREGRNPVLRVISLEVLAAQSHFFTPILGPFSRVMDNALYGGRLVQVMGEVVEVNQENGILTDFLLRDSSGNFATVSVDASVVSGSTGRNDLRNSVRLGREVQAIGILYLREDGIAALRVRDCDEVTLLSDWPYADTPYADPSNPPTGDRIGYAVFALLLSAALIWIKKRKM